MGSRIIAVCDAFDAMTSTRPYRGAMDEEAALSELERHAGTQFDEAVVEAFCRQAAEKRGAAEGAQALEVASGR
jgi:HD-GYP domain-containing protein (c-di-GMP phosphodiesterase class II)